MKPLAYENKAKLEELETKIAELESTISTLQTTVDNKVNKYTINTNYSSTGWYRTAQLHTSMSYGQSYIVSLDTSYNYTSNSSYIFAINVTYNQAKITLLSSQENVDGLISQARIVAENGITYFEFYYASGKANPVRTSVFNTSANVEMLAEATTDTATVLYTITL